MIVSNFVVSYAVLMMVSLGLCVPAAIAAWRAAGQWSEGISPDVRGRIEKAVYLVISLLVLGFLLRLAMIPFWFLTLQSVISFVPGAMCMAGVHLLDTPVSFIATALKLFIPLAYIYWLILNSIDRRIDAQPFMRLKLRLVAPLALLMLAESVLDAHFLYNIRPRIVSCCTSLFDLPRAYAVQVVRGNVLFWVYAFYISLGGSFIRQVKYLSATASIAALVFFILFLHTTASPAILETPFHQCLFCLWQAAPDIAIASAAVILGLWLNFVMALMPDVSKDQRVMLFVPRIRQWAMYVCLAGSAFITVRVFIWHG